MCVPEGVFFLLCFSLSLTLFYTQSSLFSLSLRFSLSSELHSHTLVTVIGGDEEHFEDFGESNTSELLLDTTEEGTEGEGDSSHLQTPNQSNCSSLLLSPRYGPP